MLRHTRRALGGWHLLITVVGVLVARAAAADMTGWWRMQLQAGPAQFVYVTQTNLDVAFTFAGNSYQGDVIDGRLRVFGPLPSGNARCDGGLLGAAVRDRGRRLYGGFFDIGLGCVGPFGGTMFGRRCECYDENERDGDGCDASCRIEPCFTCSGEPSQCMPTPDGGACDDQRDCTTGETCTGGACAGGSAVEPCFDLSGRWRWNVDHGDSVGKFVITPTLEQRDGYLVTVPEAAGSAGGPVDVATGAFHLSGPPLNVKDYLIGPFCVGETSGQVSPDGERVQGFVDARQWAIMCGGIGGTLHGRRCSTDACRVCPGDCDDDGEVVIGELVTSVNIALERASLEQCYGIDTDDSGTVEVSDLMTAVNGLLHGCEG